MRKKDFSTNKCLTDSFREEEGCQGLAELHLHLDGSLSPEMVRKLAADQGIEIAPDFIEKDLTVPDDCRDLNDYLKKFDLPLSLMQTEKALRTAAEDLIRGLGAEGISYAEIRFAPQLHQKKGLSQWEAAESVLSGCRRMADLAEREGVRLPETRVILCLMRSDNHDLNLETVDVGRFLKKKQEMLFAGLDLAGAEGLFPTEMFEEEFSLARREDIPFTIHAGEAAGHESVECALDFGARRIGHGVHAVQSERVMDRLAREGVVLELCPTSNLQTRAVDNIREFPLREFLKRGIRCTINSDNMTVSGTDLKHEFRRLEEEYGLTEDEKCQLIETAASSRLSG